nr:l-type lectin-domain containing receptor kinase iv.1 [Quercus suber]
MAFTICPSSNFTNVVENRYLGQFNSSNEDLTSNHILAIELDTALNPEFVDIDKNHVGIDVNSLNSTDSASAMYFSNKEGKNISLGSQYLLESMYVGFSSATGTLVASDHYVLGWSFNKSGQAQSLDVSKLPPLPQQRKTKEIPRLMIIVLVIAVILVLITITGAAYIIRRKKYEEIREDWEREYGPHRGVASGLLYLHEDWEQVILHRDIKASNVLLDAELNGRLGDFGLSRLYDHGTNPQTTHVVGTVGYLALELTRTRRATTCTDVFAFGAFMLEVACGGGL